MCCVRSCTVRAKHCAAIGFSYQATHRNGITMSRRHIFSVSCSHSPQIIAAQEEMLRKERELEEARKKLAQIRQQQYKFLPSELREDEG